MSRRFLRALLLATTLAAVLATPGHAAGKRVLAVRFDLEVNPATQDYLNHQIRRASDRGYDAVVILLDTPGGLSESMRKIVQAELHSSIPVIVYVSPPGARAASAGVWISEAADLLAMAPDTNIGSSTPISSGGGNIPDSDLRRKVINDSAASLRALARDHHRNAKWADQAVRRAVNFSADEALDARVIDMLAPTLPALLRRADGFRSHGTGRHYTLHLAGARIDEVKPGFFTRLLNVVIDPNILSLLFLAGIVGIGFEVMHPGVVLPGALGGVALLTALFGFSILPISWAGLGLVLLGIALLVIDAHVTSHGALTVSGLTSLAIGMLMLFHNAPAPYHTSVPLVLAITVTLGLFWAIALAKAVQVRRRPVAVGPTHILGAEGVVRSPGQVFVNGELWRAHPADGGELVPGEHVRVSGLEGLELTVERVETPAGVA